MIEEKVPKQLGRQLKAGSCPCQEAWLHTPGGPLALLVELGPTYPANHAAFDKHTACTLSARGNHLEPTGPALHLPGLLQVATGS